MACVSVRGTKEVGGGAPAGMILTSAAAFATKLPDLEVWVDITKHGIDGIHH
jgi:hypothetical protein